MNKEQAIKEINLEKIRKRWQEEMQGDVANLAWCDIDSLIAEIENTWKQNKRYRNAIENVLEIENYGVATDYIKTVTNILLEALEESK